MALLDDSTPPDITEGFPVPLPEGLLDSYGASPNWDVSLGLLGFNLRVSERTAYQRATEPVRKQQFDTSTSPGEQSLSSWWTRSQDSWDRGAGIRWYDPGVSEDTQFRFHASEGVDVWTPGQFSLLPRLVESPDVPPGVVAVCTTTLDGVPAVGFATGSTVGVVVPGEAPVSGALGDAGGSQPVTLGERVFVGRNGGVDMFDPSDSSVTEVATVTGSARAWIAKARLFTAVGNKLWWSAPTTPTDLSADGVLLYEHPDPDWVWVDVAEVGGAALAAGRSASDSAVFRFPVAEESGQPVLQYGEQVAVMPPGEAITAMGVYLGSSLVLGTTLGVRVGEVSDAGEVRYGPLTALTGAPVADVGFRDRFAFLGVPSGSGDRTRVLRVDLSQPSDEYGRFAYAWDVYAEATGDNVTLAFVGEDVVLSVGSAAWLPDGEPVAEGWLDTGRIRFGTNEPKAFRLVRLSGAPNGGQINVQALVDDNVFGLTSFTDESPPGAEAPVQIPGRSVLPFIELRIVLKSTNGANPVVTGVSLKASPSPSRVRLYQFPLSVFDIEQDRHGNTSGRPGDAYRRIRALEAVEESGLPLKVTDNRTGETFVGMIESVEYTVVTPPDGPEAGFGGVAIVVVRRL